MDIETILSPLELPALRERDLKQTICVVFDILRATSTMVTALANGAEAILPVSDIPEAIEARARWPEALLAGERHGLRIGRALTGTVDFDLGNSPREFTSQRITGKRIISTTTNGTRALQSCLGAREVMAASFLNLEATVNHVLRAAPPSLLLVCSGTGRRPAYEDTLAAGAMADRIVEALGLELPFDSTRMAHSVYRDAALGLQEAVATSRNGRRLLEYPDLAADVAFCAQRNTHSLVAALNSEGWLVRIS